MKLKEIHRTSTFAWSPSPSLPLLATGTVAGALDESFSNESQLEIWAPDFLDKREYDLGGPDQSTPKAFVTTSSRFNRLAWGLPDAARTRGLIVAGMENGELDIWDPSKIVENVDPSDCLIFRNKTHTGSVRGLDFNPTQPHLFSSGAVNGEIYIWDLKDPTKPYSPGSRSTKLDEITSLAWNHHVQYVLAAASSTGYTVVWDLRGKREVAALTYGGGTGTLSGAPGFVAGGMAIGGRRGMSDVAWHPDNATRLVTSSEDDMSPIIMVWDLRNARAPEKILTGHEKGVLSLSWCKQDPDLLLSCGKDNRALCWNPQTSEIIGELPSADNWAFQVQWCPRNPDLFAAGFFDGTIGIHSVQATNEDNAAMQPTPRADGSDVFDAPGFSRADRATLSLKQPPKWLRCPTSSSFGYGGKLATISNLPSAQGKSQSSIVHLRKVVSEGSVVERASLLQTAVDAETLQTFAEDKAVDAESREAEVSASWRALLSLFQANSRDELVTLLGFSKTEIAARVAEAVANLKASAESTVAIPKSSSDEYLSDIKLHEPVVSFAEPELGSSSDGEGDETLDAGGNVVENTPSEVSGSATSDTTSATRLVDGESTTTAPSLFGDDHIGTPQTDAGADFFTTMGLANVSDEPHIQVPHHNYGVDSSVAATIGSGPSSVTSEVSKNTFRIYPNDESETDRLVTRALVLGDFESAVSLCLSAERFADAILLAVKGGPELLQNTQKTYFERRTTSLPYLRLFQSIVTNDLSDIVQNADLQEWQEIFVVLCTFASQDEFPSLTEQLGRRLEFQSHLIKGSDASNAASKALVFRKNATLTYLAAGRLERLVNIWIDELTEDEKREVEDEEWNGSRYAVHAHALQTFIEKVTIFRSAIKYVDTDVKTNAGGDSSARTYKLSALYDRYFEYADLLASQGLVKEAVAFLKLTPEDYVGSPGSVVDFKLGRERLLTAAGAIRSIPIANTVDSTPVVSTKTIPSSGSAYPYTQYSQPIAPAVPTHSQPSNVYDPYGIPNSDGYSTANNMKPIGLSQYQPTSQSFPPANQYGPPSAATPQQGSAMLPPPPRFNGSGTGAAPPPLVPPPSRRRDNSGWNDAPAMVDKRPPSRSNVNKPVAITSPFPNTSPSSGSPGVSSYGGQSPTIPPPPRPGSVNSRPPPPPQARMQSPLQHQAMPPPYAPPPGQSGPPQSGPPPTLTSLHHGAGVRPPQGQYGPPPSRGPVPPGLTPGPGGLHGPQHGVLTQPPYARGTPPPGPYAPHAPPPSQQPGGSHLPAMGNRMDPPPQAAAPPPVMPPPPQGPPRSGPPSGTTAPPPQSNIQKAPPATKYPVGDRSHIPDHLRPIHNLLSSQLNHLKQVTPPQQKRLIDDVERRLNPLFDALNCETLSENITDQLLVLMKAMDAHDRDASTSIHMDLLTRGSQTDDIGLWMSGVKQLIIRL